MTDAPSPVRPMVAADYAAGQPVAVPVVSDHPTRDLVIGAVVGAAALWAVPKALDYLADRGLFGGLFSGGQDDNDESELDLYE